MPRRIPTVLLRPGWHDYTLQAGVSENRPGLYEWRIEGAGSYIGKYTWISRPKSEYERNLLRMLNGWPYRPKKPNGFRPVHRALECAYREGRQVTLIILENVDSAQLARREREVIAERGALNGRGTRY